MEFTVAPCRDDEQLRHYIDRHWRSDHVLSRDPAMFDFQYRTPWVDSTVFPEGTSVMCAYDADGDLAGFLGAIMAPYPRPRSHWLALWHVVPESKGSGLGGRLLQGMQEVAGSDDGWIGTFGAGPEALPVYLKRGYCVRAVRRWLYEPTPSPQAARTPPGNADEVAPSADWLRHRYDEHPRFTYVRDRGGVFRTEQNAWGVVTHAVSLSELWVETIAAHDEQVREMAATTGVPHLLDTWSIDSPGSGWSLAPDSLPSVFHPPEPRGNLIYASGRPFVPRNVSKGDCDQDRPN